MTREQALSQVAPNLSYFNDCKVPFAISECKSWINKIFDDFEAQMKAKDEEIKSLNCRVYHAEGYINDLHNHPKDKKFYDAKARSIVAMLFWMMKRQKAIYIKSFNALGINNHNTSFYKGAYENSKMRFKQAYKMLKENA